MHTLTREQFKKLVILQAVLLAVYIIASFFTPALLPFELQTYVEGTFESELSTLQVIGYLCALPILVWALQNLLALYQFKSYAPKHLLYITIISALLYVNIQEVVVYTNIDAFFNDVLFLMTGFTLAIVFFSNLANEFKKPEPMPDLVK